MKDRIAALVPEAVKVAYWGAWLRVDIWAGVRKHRSLLRAQRFSRKIEERYLGAEPGSREYQILHNHRARRHRKRADAAVVREQLSEARVKLREVSA